MKTLVLVKGGGDLASGIAHRLFRAGYGVIITELDKPTVIRRTVSFAAALYEGSTTVEGITAEKARIEEIPIKMAAGIIPVLIDPDCSCLPRIQPAAVIDAILAKQNTGTSIHDAQAVIAAGPGFVAGRDVHAVVETMRGHNLGRVITSGAAEPNTGVPGDIGGYTIERLLRAPVAGVFQSVSSIGASVAAGETVAFVGGVPVIAAIGGVLRGLLYDGLAVHQGMKIGDIDPRCRPEHCYTISDKARAIGGGVLEALLSLGIKPA